MGDPDRNRGKIPPDESVASPAAGGIVKPACRPSNGSTEPGGTRVQAVGLSPEIVIVVSRIIRPSVS